MNFHSWGETFIISLLFLFFNSLNTNSQNFGSMAVFYYKVGLKEINKNDVESEKDFFEKSIKEEDNPAAEYELAKIYRE